MQKQSCLNCKHCGPKSGDYIRCDHPQWEEVREGGEDDTDMRTFCPDFGELCEDHEPNDEMRDGERKTTANTTTDL